MKPLTSHLAHTLEIDFEDGERTPKNLREVEAEAVAMLCCEAPKPGRTRILPRLYPVLGKRRVYPRTKCQKDSRSR